jgi:hypothetical protein
MFTKICNKKFSGYPLFDITKYVVDGVISLNIVAHTLMRWCFYFVPIILISSLIIALLLVLIMVFIFFFMIILIKTLCGWSSIIWGWFLRLIIWVLWPHITNSHSL